MRFEAYDATGAAIDLPTPLSKTTPYTLGIATDATHDFSPIDASGTAVVPTAQSKGRLVMSKADTLTLPDLRGRTPIGAGQGEGLTLRALGIQGGDEEMQEHTHRVLSETTGGYGSVNDLAGAQALLGQDISGHGNRSRNYLLNTYGGNAAYPSIPYVQATGTGQSGNMQPYLPLHYIIKT